MSAEQGENSKPGTPPARVLPITQWVVWSLPGRALTVVLIVEITAVALIAVHLIGPGSVLDIGSAAVLSLLGIAHTEIAVGVERIRRRVTESLHIDLSSVWTFAGAVILPPAYAAIVAVVVFAHLWWRAWRPRVPLYRHLFSTATVVLACIAASAVVTKVGSGDPARVLGGGRELVALGAALLIYTTVNIGLVAGAIAVSTPRATVPWDWDEIMLEVATLCLGAVAAVALALNPWLVVLLLPPLLVLHRAVLVRQLEEAASTDSKTGLLNAAAWHFRAERELLRADRRRQSAAALILDLDHFKAVNDKHGHLVGDQVLSSVAAALRSEVRDKDLVGRFGGEEFVVLLSGLDGPRLDETGGNGSALEAVAERLRCRVAELRVEVPTPDGPMTVGGLSVSVGGARFPEHGGDLRALLEVADSALFAAKRAGRNSVRVGGQPPDPGYGPTTGLQTLPPERRRPTA
ncbi:MAG: GGDEF domain-containing protein [Pseudonocardia sp.]